MSPSKNSKELLRLESLFSALIELEPEKREAFLRDNAGDATQRMLDELLHADSGLGSMTAQRAMNLSPRESTQSGRPAPERIGDFAVECELGRGGMGTVYLAQRAVLGGTQRIAVKCLHPLGAAADFERRFQSEIDVLARLSHPHIARLIDAGREADGSCWIAMEYIEGVPLLQYCDERRLPLPARLALFDTLCDAVSAAHRSLIVHRDIKSSNVLVREDGELFLIDFGIARALSTTADATQPEQRFLSPLNAAPEQVRGEPTTTACDVYGLGVILYELLSGIAPIEPNAPSGEAMRQAVLNHVPPLASARVRQLARSDPKRALLTAQARGETDAGRLARALQGDLEQACSVALRKQPQERYASVDQLREDLARNCNGLPLRVRGNDRWYRTSRWLRRHAVAVSFAALAALALAVGVTLLWLQALALERERDRALAQTALAQQQGQRAEFLSAFMLDAFEQADPSHTIAGNLTARQILQAGVRQLRDASKGDPEARIRIGLTMADVLYRLGLFKENEELVAFTRERLAELPHAPLRLLAQQHYVASQSLYHDSQFAQARDEVDAGLAALGMPDDGPSDRLWLGLERMRAELRQSLGDRAGRLQAFRELSVAAASLKGLSRIDVWEIRLRLATYLNLNSNTRDEARSVVEAVLREQAAASADGTAIHAAALSELAVIENRSNHSHVGRGYAQQAFDLNRGIYGEDHIVTARALNNLAVSEQKDNAPQLAIEHFTRAAAIFDQSGNAGLSIGARFNIGIAYDEGLHDYHKAEQYFRLAAEDYKKTFGPDSNNAIISETALANVLIEQERYREAEPLLLRDLNLWQQNQGDEESISQLQVEIALVRHAEGRDSEATDLLRQWLVAFRKYADPDNYILARAEALAKKLHLP